MHRICASVSSLLNYNLGFFFIDESILYKHHNAGTCVCVFSVLLLLPADGGCVYAPLSSALFPIGCFGRVGRVSAKAVSSSASWLYANVSDVMHKQQNLALLHLHSQQLKHFVCVECAHYCGAELKSQCLI